MGHLATALEADHPVSFQQLGITENKINMVLAVIRAAPINSDVNRLVPIKDKLGDTVNFGELRLIRAYLSKKYGTTRVSGPSSLTSSNSSSSSTSSKAPGMMKQGGKVTLSRHFLEKSAPLPDVPIGGGGFKPKPSPSSSTSSSSSSVFMAGRSPAAKRKSSWSGGRRGGFKKKFMFKKRS